MPMHDSLKLDKVYFHALATEPASWPANPPVRCLPWVVKLNCGLFLAVFFVTIRKRVRSETLLEVIVCWLLVFAETHKDSLSRKVFSVLALPLAGIVYYLGILISTYFEGNILV